ncbi:MULTISPECIES: type II toxin-antitoxin system Phd/YefM family antitoxin [Nocardiaceae]|uniref:Antitoxin n=1 Tax=Rhodococcoides yunnanense TaxID=278209 RepID=A0ABU4BIJ9_9NOCA|nr:MULTISPECIES: type II toxin-antitoxin system prevent-host-death family antitoxin [Rhodococcus]MDI9897985.1 type II toxin-antitoxin system prevent-host-death family antitoxin [Rhodococcus sp. IEGM 1381]MDV6264051.1 type II toxin-antitoxin system prevent-host-death family antitoxin [Rhodococcus yunnanensis]
MERIGVRELRQHASRYLARVKAGETVEVTDRGELVALLVPPEPGRSAVERLAAEGRLTAATLPVRFPNRVRTETPTQSMLDEMREDR